MNVALATIAFIKAQTAVTALVGTHVYGATLPRTLIESGTMPTYAIVVRHAGGGRLGKGGQLLRDRRLDIDTYGATPQLADDLYEALSDRLRLLGFAGSPRFLDAGSHTLLHWAIPENDGINVVDPNTTWPLTFSSWQVLASPVS